MSQFCSSYRPGIITIIDEQLTLWIQNVPERETWQVGIKISEFLDISTSYCLNLQPYGFLDKSLTYLGRICSRECEQGQKERVVLGLTDSISGSGRHITGNKFFTSLALVRSLLPKNLTYSIMKSCKNINLILQQQNFFLIQKGKFSLVRLVSKKLSSYPMYLKKR